MWELTTKLAKHKQRKVFSQEGFYKFNETNDNLVYFVQCIFLTCLAKLPLVDKAFWQAWQMKIQSPVWVLMVCIPMGGSVAPAEIGKRSHERYKGAVTKKLRYVHFFSKIKYTNQEQNIIYLFLIF